MEHLILLIFIFFVACQSAPEIKAEEEIKKPETCEEGLSKEMSDLLCK
jgi:hypothetical protein